VKKRASVAPTSPEPMMAYVISVSLSIVAGSRGPDHGRGGTDPGDVLG
jgi:hypothetical protein